MLLQWIYNPLFLCSKYDIFQARFILCTKEITSLDRDRDIHIKDVN